MPVSGLQRCGQFEPDWWNLSCVNALSELMDHTEGTIVIGASDRNTRSGLSHAVTMLPSERVKVVSETDAIIPDYIMANMGYASIAGFEPSEGMTPVVVIESYGSPVNIIYRLEGSELP